MLCCCRRWGGIAVAFAGAFAAVTLVLGLGAGPGGAGAGEGAGGAGAGLVGAATITVYSGRSEALVGPALEKFQQETGHTLRVRYGETAELAALLLEEGERTPASVFFAQDAGALGALARRGRLVALPDSILTRVDPRFRSPRGDWVGVTGRARTLVYNTQKLTEAELPASVLELTDPKWRGRIGWAPTNGSFQAFVTAMRVQLGEERTEAWLRGVMANKPQEYPKNSEIVRAVGAGEVDVGLVNHYYLFRFTEANPEFPAKNHSFKAGDPGALINVAGAGILKRRPPSPRGGNDESREVAEQLIMWLLSEEAQKHFVAETHEYPLVEGVAADEALTPLAEIQSPDIDLSDLDDLEGTLKLLRKVGALP
jgi:iron(III) transport system substrate-binding protein